MIVKVIKENILLFTSYISVILIGIVVLISTEKFPLQISINQFSSDSTDTVFLLITKLAEGWITVPVIIYFLVKDWRKALLLGICYGATALIAGLIKNYAFDINFRPFGFKILRELESYHWIKDYRMPSSFSFPSGHTTTAFTFAIIVGIFNKNKHYALALIFAATLVGFSRIFLSFHFLIDVVAGAIIGGVTSLVLYVMLKNRLKIDN